MRKIILDCERMKYNHTGLYHYCLQLGQALQRKLNPATDELSFYVRQSEHGIFGHEAHYIPQQSLQKFWLPPLRKYDLWHATYQGTQYFPFWRSIKIVLTIHDLNFMHDPNKTEAKRQRELRKLQKKINRADHIVAISDFVLQDIKKHLQLGDTPATVIYNGCNFSAIDALSSPSMVPQRQFLYTIGTITDKKNFHVLPALLVNTDYDLVISGITQSEAYKAKIISEAENHKVADRIIFTDAITENDKQWYMKHCKAFVFPSLAEGFGLPVVEAMHFGKPVLLSTCTALPEIGGDAAYYFKNFEPDHMQEVLQQSLADYEIDAAKQDEIKKRAHFFNWDHTAQQYLDVYHSVY